MSDFSLATTIFVLGIVLVLWYSVYLVIMRTGSLNPIDWIWGSRLYDITNLDDDILLCEINQFPGDEYMIDWHINMTETYRDKGPWFARKRKWVAFSAYWSAIEAGIPTNHGYIKDTWSGVFDIKDPFDWRYDADEQLKAWVKATREENGYVGQITDFEDDASMWYDDFGASISFPDPDTIITSTSDNDLLKSKYTIEELAQQAVNRDKDPDD